MEKALNAQIALGMGSGHRRFPPDLVSLQRAYNGEWRTEIGPDPTFSTTGPQVDEAGNPTAHNYVPNSEGVGGGVGVLPTGWTKQDQAGITISPLASDTTGTNIRVTGTAGVAGGIKIRPHGITELAALLGQTWTASLTVTLIGESSLPVNSALAILERSSGGAFLFDSNTLLSPALEATITRTFISGTAAIVCLELYIPIANGQTVDFTIRISKPQLSKSSTKLTYVPTYGSAAFGPSITDKGLAAMGAWTNAIPAANVETPLSSDASVVTVAGVTTVTEVGTSLIVRYVYFGLMAFTSGLYYTLSRKVKMGGRRYVQLTAAGPAFGTSQYANFDLLNGTVTASTGGVATITSEGDGYFTLRFTVLATATITEKIALLISVNSGTSLRAESCTGINGIAFYTKHAMCVQSQYLYPYAPPGITVPASSSTTGGNGTNTAMTPGVYESVTDGVELAGSPAVFVVNASNYSSYNATTGECRIVSDGTFVQLTVPCAVSTRYLIKYTQISATGSVKASAATVGTDTVLTGQHEVITTAVGYFQIARNGACDVRFYISIQRITGSVYVPGQGDKMLECLRGRTDGVSYLTNPNNPSTYTQLLGAGSAKTAITNGIQVTTTASGGYRSEGNISTSVTIGSRYRLRATYRPITATDTSVRINDGLTDIYLSAVNSTTTPVSIDVEIIATSAMLLLYLRNSGAGIGEFTDISLERLLPSVFTSAALVYVGAGSGEFSDNTSQSVATTSNSILSHLRFYGSASPAIVATSDFSNYPILGGPWNRDEIHLKVVQTNSAGTQFRVGNRRYTSSMVPIDTLTWSSWAAYDGSMNPLTHLRLALNGTIPLWFRMVSLSKKSLSDAEILRLLKYTEQAQSEHVISDIFVDGQLLEDQSIEGYYSLYWSK